jgi:cytoskeleton protein RodZ
MSESAQALGAKLKEAREKRGMSAQKMADDMHLDAWVIDALEAGDYERIGPSVYAKGHLKKYASILGVSATQPDAAPSPTPPGLAAPTPIIRLDPPGGNSALWPAVSGLVAVALVAGGIVWWRPWHRAAATPPAPLATRAPAPASAPAAIDDAPTPAGGAQAATVTSSDVAAASAAPAASPAELTPGVGRARLRLSFSADSRVAVYDYAGKPVFTGDGRANSVKTVSGMAPLRVYLGFASGVQLQVNDHAVAIGPQFVTGDVARFEAGADGVLRRDPRPLPVNGIPVPGSPRG